MFTEIAVNTLVDDTETGDNYIILWLSDEQEMGYWLNLSSASRIPKLFSKNDIVLGVKSGRYEISLFSNSKLIRPENLLSKKEKEHRDRLWDIIGESLEEEPDIYDRTKRATILKKVAVSNNLNQKYLYALLDRYWRSGKTKNAFIPNYSNCGGKGKIREGKQKLGKPSESSDSIGKMITEADRKNFAKAVEHHYHNRDKLSFSQVYEKLLADHYAVKTEDKTLKLFSPNEIPSLRQFRYWYSKNRDIVTEKKKREGDKKFELNSRAVLGRSDYGLQGPGAQFQIDATVGDVYLVSQFDRSDIIGRPVMYFIIDTFSRMVVGMGVSLEGPSWATAASAIANMSSDKVAYCKEYGVEISADEWQCHHIPESLLCDRGEMESQNANNLVDKLGIRVTNAPPYRADLKGIIEQHFHTINTDGVALLPGSVKPDMSKRGGHDYRLDAALDIRQFTQIIIKCVLYYNNHHCMDYFEKNEAMIRDNVKPIPTEIWNWGVIHHPASLRTFPEEMVKLAVLPTSNATVTAKGIKFHGLFYKSDRSLKEQWFEKARSGKSWHIQVSYDPNDVDNIYTWSKEESNFDECILLDWNRKNSGKTIFEVKYEQQKEKLQNKTLKLADTEAKINLNADIEAIVSQAKESSKKSSAKIKDRTSFPNQRKTGK